MADRPALHLVLSQCESGSLVGAVNTLPINYTCRTKSLDRSLSHKIAFWESENANNVPWSLLFSRSSISSLFDDSQYDPTSSIITHRHSSSVPLRTLCPFSIVMMEKGSLYDKGGKASKSQNPSFKTPASLFNGNINLSKLLHLFEIQFLYHNTR